MTCSSIFHISAQRTATPPTQIPSPVTSPFSLTQLRSYAVRCDTFPYYRKHGDTYGNLK